MILGKVKGSVWSTKKDENLNGHKLLIVETQKETIVASDAIGAGIDDWVLLSFGNSARSVAGTAIDVAIVGIVDSYEYK